MKIYDMIGVGIGPSNLSTAALLYPIRNNIDYLFFDNKKEFKWHPGMLFPNVTIQVSILKDLVSMVDPANPFSFLNFLKKTGRLYMFASKGSFDGVKRKEFEQYFKWCTNYISDLHFSSTVESLKYDNGYYKLQVNGKEFVSKNIISGAGLTAKIPDCCKPFMGNTMFHSTQFLISNTQYSGKRITVVGGGQSGAEIILHLLNNENIAPENINWINSSYNLLPMEDSPFSNELYSPIYSNYFYDLKKESKETLLEKQKQTSDGISESTLNELYELLYNNKFLFGKSNLNINMNSYLTKVTQNPMGDFDLEIHQKDNDSKKTMLSDIVILATGLEYKIPKFLYPIMDDLVISDGRFEINEDYSIKSKKPNKGKIYLHNGARHIRGVADPNLSLIAWRSAKIINSVMKKEIYDIKNDKSAIHWGFTSAGSKKNAIEELKI